MALSADGNWITKEVFKIAPVSMVVLNASVIYNTSLCSHDTTTGEIKPFDGTATDKVVGWAFDDTKTGNSSGARVRASIVAGGFIVRELAVTGVANDATDYGAAVYASDDGTYTLVTTANKLVGRIISDDNRSTGNASVFMFPVITGLES